MSNDKIIWSYQQKVEWLMEQCEANTDNIDTLNTDLENVNLHNSVKHTINVNDWTLDDDVYSYTITKESNDGVYTVAPDSEAINVITNQAALAKLQIAIKETSSEIILMTTVEPESTVYITVYFDTSKLNLGGE